MVRIRNRKSSNAAKISALSAQVGSKAAVVNWVILRISRRAAPLSAPPSIFIIQTFLAPPRSHVKIRARPSGDQEGEEYVSFPNVRYEIRCVFRSNSKRLYFPCSPYDERSDEKTILSPEGDQAGSRSS